MAAAADDTHESHEHTEEVHTRAPKAPKLSIAEQMRAIGVLLRDA